MDHGADPGPGGLDVGERDVVVRGLGHAREYARASRSTTSPTGRGPPLHLRACASGDMILGMLDRLPVSAEPDRQRYAAVGRALGGSQATVRPRVARRSASCR